MLSVYETSGFVPGAWPQDVALSQASTAAKGSKNLASRTARYLAKYAKLIDVFIRIKTGHSSLEDIILQIGHFDGCGQRVASIASQELLLGLVGQSAERFDGGQNIFG